MTTSKVLSNCDMVDYNVNIRFIYYMGYELSKNMGYKEEEPLFKEMNFLKISSQNYNQKEQYQSTFSKKNLLKGS